MLNPFCSVIVLNFNGERVLRKCLDSVFNLNNSHDSYEVIVVDNASQDLSRKILEEYSNKKNLKIVYSSDNLGFSKGNNLGIKHAKGEYIALLNNDCTTSQDWLTELIKTAEGDRKIFAVSSKLLLGEAEEKKSAKIQNAGTTVFQDGYGRDRGAVIGKGKQDYELDKNQYNKEEEVYAACAAAVLYRKDVLEKIGFLDESFFMYYEDVEISERARLSGYKSVFCPKAEVRHLHAYSSKEWSPFFLYHTEKGRLLHVFYNFPFTVFINEYLVFSIKSILRLFLSFAKMKKMTNALQYIKVSIFFILFSPLIINFRILKRKKYIKHAVKQNYQSLLEGEWLFH